MSSTSDSFGRRAGRAFTRLVVTLLVLALLGTVGFLLSRLNARTFTVQQQDGKLLVLKGRMLPLGTEPYRPPDPVLAAAYAPIDLLGGSAAGLDGAKFDERDALDRALFQFLEGLARPRLVSDDPAVLSQGLGVLGRMEKLGGITDEQRRTLRSLESEVAFFQARTRLDQARRDIAEAVTQLRLAADSGGRHARPAHRMLSVVEPSAAALEEALRRAVYTLDSDLPETPVQPVPGAPASPGPAAPTLRGAQDAGTW
ncbi:MAG TPA: IF-2 protein [Myxococcaceae bacterium]|nr:IF-2 protein [Myxococcaceae bacterium]